MSDFDFQRASMLLHIVKAVAEHGGALSYIGQLANMELADLNDEASDAIAEYKDQLAADAQANAAAKAEVEPEVEEPDARPDATLTRRS